MTFLLWLNNHRLNDNPAVQAAVASCRQHNTPLICATHYWPYTDNYGIAIDPAWSAHRRRFNEQSLSDLAEQLARCGQTLYVIAEPIQRALNLAIKATEPLAVHCSDPHSPHERHSLLALQHTATVPIHAHRGLSLFDADQLPFSIADLPPTFSQFRKQLEALVPRAQAPKLMQLPLPPRAVAATLRPWQSHIKSDPQSTWIGGTDRANRHINQ